MVRKSAEERKEEIVTTALELMADVGPDRVTTAMIAERIGLTQPALFRHFPTKQHLLLEVTAWLKDHLLGSFWQDLHGPADQQLRRLVENHLTLISSNPAVPTLLFSREIVVKNEAVREELRLITSAYQKKIIRLIEKGQEEDTLGKNVDARQTSFLLLSFLPGLAIHWLLREQSFDLVKQGLRLYDRLSPLFAVGKQQPPAKVNG